MGGVRFADHHSHPPAWRVSEQHFPITLAKVANSETSFPPVTRKATPTWRVKREVYSVTLPPVGDPLNQARYCHFCAPLA